MDLESRRRAADTNMVETFARTIESFGDPRGARARFGRVEAIVTGVDDAFFNFVVVVDPQASRVDVRAAAAWVAGRGVSYSVFVRDDVGEEIRSALMLVADPSVIPSMVLEPIPSPVPQAPAGLVIRVGGGELFDEWHTALESSDVFQRLFGRSLIADPDALVAVGYLEGSPVSGAAAIHTAGVVGIYALWTQEPARRRGFGRAVTWAAIDAGVLAWGAAASTLQSSDMGEPIYRSMGFEAIASYTRFALPRPAAEPD